jgi:mannose-6-phosphate isomerase-like protein (cupin superfamily)
VDDNHLWGRELRMVNEHEYCSKILELTYPARSSVHFHKEKKETFIVLEGVVTIQVGSTMRDYGAGEQVTVLPMTEHSFMLSKKNGGRKALILESSTHHEDSDTYRVRPSVTI